MPLPNCRTSHPRGSSLWWMVAKINGYMIQIPIRAVSRAGTWPGGSEQSPELCHLFSKLADLAAALQSERGVVSIPGLSLRTVRGRFMLRLSCFVFLRAIVPKWILCLRGPFDQTHARRSSRRFISNRQFDLTLTIKAISLSSRPFTPGAGNIR